MLGPHHELVLHLDLVSLDEDDFVPAARYVHPEIEQWLRTISRGPALLASKPINLQPRPSRSSLLSSDDGHRFDLDQLPGVFQDRDAEQGAYW